MLPDERLRGTAHRVRIECAGVTVEVFSLENVRRAAVPYAVEIALLRAGKPRMEPRRRLLERERADILRQVLPQPAISTGWPSRRVSSASIFSCMVLPVLPCFCQPLYRLPS